MTYAERTFMGDGPTILLERFAAYVRPYPAKKLAEWFGCTEKTAENFRAGVSWPNARHWRLIVRTFGRDILAALYDPEIDNTLARLRREERELEERLHELRARRRSAAGDLAGDEERREPASHRTALDRDLFDDGARP
jgi:hypothetical protein